MESKRRSSQLYFPPISESSRPRDSLPEATTAGLAGNAGWRQPLSASASARCAQAGSARFRAMRTRRPASPSPNGTRRFPVAIKATGPQDDWVEN